MRDDRLLKIGLHPGAGAVARRDWDRLFPEEPIAPLIAFDMMDPELMQIRRRARPAPKGI